MRRRLQRGQVELRLALAAYQRAGHARHVCTWRNSSHGLGHRVDAVAQKGYVDRRLVHHARVPGCGPGLGERGAQHGAWQVGLAGLVGLAVLRRRQQQAHQPARPPARSTPYHRQPHARQQHREPCQSRSRSRSRSRTRRARRPATKGSRRRWWWRAQVERALVRRGLQHDTLFTRRQRWQADAVAELRVVEGVHVG